MSSRPPPAARGARSVAAVCAFKLLDAAMAAGIDHRKLPRFELKPNDGDLLEARIPHDELVEMWESVMRASGDPGFPIFVGARVRPADYDAIGFACMTRANLGEALRQAVRFS